MDCPTSNTNSSNQQESFNNQGSLKTKIELAVQMKSPECVQKVKTVIGNIKGINLLSICRKSQKLVLEGETGAEAVKCAIEQETGMSTVVLGQGSDQNLGAGVAALSVSEQGVLGLLRLVQNTPTSCIIEGAVDSLPASRPLYLSLHESGDLSDGCNSCGDLLTAGQSFNGILGQLSSNEQQRAEFRLSTSGVKLSDMIGRCVVVHEGDKHEVVQGKSKRLTCGIVARASGLYQNSKRFCACDGVTIWEQKDFEKAGRL